MEENEKNYLDWEGLLEYHRNLETKLSEKANTEDLADVAISGDYNDLDNTPTNVSLFTNDVGYMTSEIDNTNGHDYVEIGGIKWATKNIGASRVTDIGLYFQWGDILGYTSEEVGVDKNFTWEDYKFNPSGDGTTFSKYNSTDLKTSLDTEDDAAANAWGSDWRVPTTSELQTLSQAVNISWTDNYQESGVPGLILTDKEDSSKVLFLPATGVCNDGSIIDDNTTGFYWSKSLGNTDDKGLGLGFDKTNGTTWEYNNSRSLGFAIRPVLEGPAKRTIMGVTQLEKDKWNSKVSGIKIGESGNVNIPTNGIVTLPNQEYNLPTASANTLGGVKVGDNLSIDQNGVLSASPDEVQIGGNTPSSDSNIKIFIDTIEDATAEIYTKQQQDGKFVIIKDLNAAPTESTLTYTENGTVKNFKQGDEVRVADQESDTGYTFYKLYAFTTEEGVTTATWDKLDGGGGSVNPNETVNISLTQVGGSSADLIGASVTITNDDSGDTLYTDTWAGTMLTTEIDVNTNYTVSVEDITGYKKPISQSYTAIYQGERFLNFVYAAVGVYIEATDGTLHTSSAWSSANKTANSIVIITSEHSMRMSLTESNLPLSNGITTDPTPYMTVRTESQARADFDGEGNTIGLLRLNAASGATTTSYAPTYWRNYVFPDGVTTGAYIMAMGQNRMIEDNATAINACLNACGGDALGSVGRAGLLWSSSFQGYMTGTTPNGAGMWYGGSSSSIAGGYITDTFGTRGCTDY